MKKTAKLIVLEGLDGAGKSTQIELIKKYFEKHNLTYTYLHFPKYGHNPASDVISAYLRGEYGNIEDVSPIFVANIYAMDRFLYLPELRKYMFDYDVVLLDRYVFSNMAYQGGKYNAELQSQVMRDWINEFEFGFLELPYPDINIFFDVPIETIKKRLEDKREGEDRRYLKGKSDIHEMDMQFQRKVREQYLALEGYQGYKIIPVEDKSPEEIFEMYETHLNRIILNKVE